jgi:hypothetical protein
MAQMLYNLPPLSPDYSGVASVFHDLGALTIIHDAAGCTGTYTGYDEPRWFSSKSPAFSSGLRDMDAIMGDDEKLVNKIQGALKITRAPCVSVIGSPVPMVIGFDFKGFASLVESRTGLPAFGFPATGLGYYDQGQRDAYLAIAKRFLKTGKEVSPGSSRRVNILGASVLDGFDQAALDSLEGLLEEASMERAAVWGFHSSLEEISESANAAVNWVLTAAALPLARYLQERYGIPFVVGLPIGEKERQRFLKALGAAMGKQAERIPPAKIPKGEPQGDRILIVGEALFCASLRAYLETERNIGSVCIGTFFQEGKELLRPGDFFFTGEAEAEQALRGDHIKAVIADPLLRELLDEKSSTLFIDIPHRAVSGRMYAESVSEFFGASIQHRLEPLWTPCPIVCFR